MYFLIFFLFGILGALIQSTVLQAILPHYFIPDLTLLLVLYLSLFFPLGRGLAASFILGLLADLMSGAPDGLNALFAMSVFVINKTIQARIFLKHSEATFGLFLLDFAFKLPFFLAISFVFKFTLPYSVETASVWLGELVSTFIIMPPLFSLLARILGTQSFMPTQDQGPRTV